MKISKIFLLFLMLSLLSCNQKETEKIDKVIKTNYLSFSQNILNFKGTPKDKADRDMLMFSDQGAWFAYGLPDSVNAFGGFTGPFLMTQENGVWIGPNLTRLQLKDGDDDSKIMDWENDLAGQNSYASHLEQTYKNQRLHVEQQLVFVSGHTALQRTVITNESDADITLNPRFSGNLFNLGIRASKEKKHIKLESSKSDAVGYVQLLNEQHDIFIRDSLSFEIKSQTLVLPPKSI